MATWVYSTGAAPPPPSVRGGERSFAPVADSEEVPDVPGSQRRHPESSGTPRSAEGDGGVGGVVGLVALPTLSACSGAPAPGGGNGGTPSLLPAPEQQVPPLLDSAKVGQAVERLDGLIQDAMTRTGVPGIAAAVVHQDKVVYLKGFGVREAGKPEKVGGPDTVFQLASVSKPLASTVLAAVVGAGEDRLDRSRGRSQPGLLPQGPYVTSHATFVDLLSHRSGLHTGAGDLLEDLGFDRDYILGHLNQQPLDTFRSSYNYSNFGYTAGGEWRAQRR